MKMFGWRRWINNFSLLLIFVAVSSGFFACKESTDEEIVTLTLTSWRTDDVEQMNRINDLFSLSHPMIKINFVPEKSSDYDEITRDALSNDVGADIIFLRSYDKGLELFDLGYLVDLTNEIPNLESYSAVSKEAWTSNQGITYGVPSVGVTHGIYYNKSIFEKYNISEPQNWEAFIAACELLHNSGEIVFAQGAFDSWTLYEAVFSALGANFYGGEASRQALLNGDMKLTDSNFIEAFEAVNSLRKYLPEDYANLDYEEMQQLFGTGKAAMFIGGSWEISVFDAYGSDSSTIGWFAPPVKTDGDKIQYCFHTDAGIGLNKKTRNMEAALEYIKWVSSSEYAQAVMNELPGFFSYTPEQVSIVNPLASKMFDITSNSDLTVRLMCEKLSSQEPSGNIVMGEALNGMMLGTYSPETAAEYVQSELDTWYMPLGQ